MRSKSGTMIAREITYIAAWIMPKLLTIRARRFSTWTMITSGTLELPENPLGLLTRPPAATRMLLIMQDPSISPRHEINRNLLQSLLHNRFIPIAHRSPRISTSLIQYAQPPKVPSVAPVASSRHSFQRVFSACASSSVVVDTKLPTQLPS